MVLIGLIDSATDNYRTLQPFLNQFATVIKYQRSSNPQTGTPVDREETRICGILRYIGNPPDKPNYPRELRVEVGDDSMMEVEVWKYSIPEASQYQTRIIGYHENQSKVLEIIISNS